MSALRPCTAVQEHTFKAIERAYARDGDDAHNELTLASRALRVPDDVLMLNAACEAVEYALAVRCRSVSPSVR